MTKFLNTSYKILMFVLALIFFYITIVSAFFGINDHVSPIVVILGAIITYFLFKKIYQKLDKLSNKKIKIFAIVLSLLFFIGLLLVGLFLPISSVTDLSHIIEYANRMISENSLTITGPYFSKYTNQIPLLLLAYYFTQIGNLFGISNVVLMGTIFNALFISITGYFIYLIGKEIKGPKAGLLSLIFMVINPIFYLYTSYFYTDTLCMPFAIIGLYFLIKCLKGTTSKNRLINGIISGFVFYMGLKVRIVVSILLIASLAYIIINNKIVYKLKIFVVLFLGLIIGFLGFKLIQSNFNIELDKNASFPITHWVMMGLNEEYSGGYNEQDHNLTLKEETKKDKQEANMEMIKKRLKDLGLIGLIKLEGVKIARTFSSGNYGVYAKLNNTSDGSGIYEYLGGYGNSNIFLKYSLQILKTYINLIIFLGILKIIRKKENTYQEDTIIYIALFGAILFYMIWEAAQRYSLSFLPWMIILLGFIYSKLGENNDKENKNKIFITIKNHQKQITKITSITIMCITLILLTINFPKYTLEEKNYDDVKILSYRGFSEIEINDDKISQTFITSDAFNQIKIRLNNINEKEESIYLFRLYDDEKNLLAEIKFNSKDIKDGSNHKFNFKKINPNKKTTYQIELSKLYGSSVLSVGTFNESIYYKSYNNGSVFINDKKVSDTFIFRVDEKNKRSYINISTYLLLTLFIFSIEWFSLKDYIKNKKDSKNLSN